MKTKTKMMIKMTIDGQVTLDWPRDMTLKPNSNMQNSMMLFNFFILT